MVLHRLDLRDFRNYESLHASFGPSVNIMIGDNAQGKTNLLEAVFTLATGKSFRTSRDTDLIRWGSDSASICGSASTRLSSIDAEVKVSRALPKVVSLGGNTYRRLSDYVGNITVVTFSPDDLQLAKGSPVARRRFLDMFISQADNTYCRAATLYARIVQQRNAALRVAKADSRSVAALEPWTDQLIEVGSKLVARRLEAVQKIAGLSQSIASSISSGTESLSVSYVPSFALPRDARRTDPGGIAEAMASELAARNREEIARGVSLIGPHRDDLSLVLNGFDLRTYGSQGQQKSAVLSLKMAEVEYLREETGEYPILLLDDVMSELDHLRQSRLLLSVTRETQAIITTTDLAAVGDTVPDSAVVLAVSEGTLCPYEHWKGGRR